MPQLNPTPWFFIFFISWTIFLVFSPMKMSALLFPNEPLINPNTGLNKPWLWPWL
uniref:ATP synthase complex subunit 8 n=1 Tax=Aplastodiscus arildae TaxID=318305 RepID=A0A7U3N0N5_9NEOB|nr:ATP synthase F0 subunit 8 [Aplastodiscus arildae]